MKRMMWMLVSSLAATAAFVAPAAAQQSEDAKASLNESTAVLRGVEALQFKSKRHVTGAFKGLIDCEGEVWIYRPKGAQHAMFRVRGTAKQPGGADKKIEVVGDGTVVRWIDHTKNTLFVRPVNDRETKQEMTYVDQLLLQEFLQPSPYAKELTSDKLEKTGIEQVNNEVCEIITASPKEGGRARIWALSQVDRLPRRMELAQGDGEQKVSWIFEAWDVKTDAKLSAKDFDLPLPEGFKLDERVPQAAAPANAVPPPAVELGVPVGATAPAFSLKTADGKDLTLASMKGSPVVLEFFGTMFKKSTEHAADMQALADQHKNVKFVGLACRESDDMAAKSYFQSNNLSYTLVPKADAAVAEYKVIGFPSYYVIDTDGNVAAFFQGWPGKDKLEEAITAAAK